jgi:hypothetical protein
MNVCDKSPCCSERALFNLRPAHVQWTRDCKLLNKRWILIAFSPIPPAQWMLIGATQLLHSELAVTTTNSIYMKISCYEINKIQSLFSFRLLLPLLSPLFPVATRTWGQPSALEATVRSLMLHIFVPCEHTWPGSLTIKIKHRLRVLENRMLRRTFGRKGEKITRIRIKLQNEELYNF